VIFIVILVRERKIAIEEMRILQEEMFKCYYASAPDHHTKCKHLVDEYKERLSWPYYIPPTGYDGETTTRLRRSKDGSYEMKN